MRNCKKKRIRGHRMFTRVFLHGLLLIAVVTVASALIFHMFGQPQHWREMIDRMAMLLADDLGPEGSEQAALVKRLEEIHLVTGTAVAVYRTDGRVVASAGDQTPSPLNESEALSLLQEEESHHYSSGRFAIPLPARTRAPRAYVLVARAHTGGMSRAFIVLAIVVVLVAFLSIPLVHAITRPLKRLTETARKLASGDLTARTGIVRGGEVGILAKTMDEMADGLATRIRAEKELLANVSHEIRSPLARINVALELCAEEDSTDAEVKKHLEGIADDVTSLERLVEDVLAAARLDLTADSNGESKLVLRTERVDLAELVSISAERFASDHPGRKLVLADLHKLPSIEADPLLVRRIIDNLLDNAAKYSPRETGIEICLFQKSEYEVMEVNDRGIGIPEEDLAKIFEPFFQANRSRTPGTGGVGLGLTLCKRIVTAHGGVIEALPRDGGGTTFRVSLPSGNK